MADIDIRSVVAAVYSANGDDVLDKLVEGLVNILRVDYALVSKLTDNKNTRAHTLSFYADGKKADNFDYNLLAGPCETLLDGEACIFNGNVQRKFPDDRGLREKEVESYIGVTLFASGNEPIGIIAVMNRTPVDDPESVRDVLQLFASRAANELDWERRESTLRESEMRFRNLVEGSIQGVYIHRDMNLLFVNRAFAEMLGYESPEDLMADRSLLRLFHPDEHERLLGYKDRRLAGEDVPTRYEVRALRRDGGVIWLENNAHIIEWSGGRAIQSTNTNITERKLAEERIRSITEVVSSVSGDNLLDRLAGSVVEILGVDCAYIGIFADDEESRIRTVTFIADGAKADNFEYALAGSPCQNVVGKGICVFNGDVQQKFPEDKGLIKLGVESYIGVPLFGSEDEPLGIVVALNRKPLDNPDTISDLLHIFGVRIAAELERLRADAILKESEERLRAVLDNATAVIFVKDIDGRYILVNRQFEDEKKLSNASDEIIGKTAHDLHSKEIADILRRNDLEVLEKNAPMEFEEIIPLPDGQHTFISIKFPLRDAAGKPYAVCGISTDITARKEAENALVIQARNLEIAEQIASIGYWRIDVATRDIFFSDEMYRLRGFEVGSPITWSMLRDASHPDDWKLAEEANRKAIKEKKGSELERRVIWPNGETRVLHSTFRVELGDDGEVVAIVGVSQDITRRRRAEEELARAETRYRDIVENSTDGIFRSNEEGRLLWANTAMARMGGFETAEELLSAVKDITTDIFVNPDDRKNLIEQLKKWGTVKNFVAQGSRPKTGEKFWFDSSIRAERDADGMLYMEGVIRDITDARRNDERMRRVEKMQAIGQLTGGIAHDFNNLLGIVIGNLDMLEEDIGDDPNLGRAVATALRAALRGANLTKQLLAFSRQTEEEAKPTSLNEAIKGLDELMAGSLTAKIKVQTFLDDDLWFTKIDQGDFQDALLNLAINARDAMPIGGMLVVETKNTVLEPTNAETNPDIPPDEYVMVSVSDSGSGMTKEVVNRIFEPFFTTKQAGKGTGLGLSLVHSFVQRSKGHIRVYSEPGSGTTIRILLPRARHIDQEPSLVQNIDETVPRGQEVVLVVDDEPDLVDLAKRMLETLGYRVFTAGNGKEALKELSRHLDVDVLFTDVVMPGGMNGLELVDRALEQKPDLKVLLTSGFSDKIPRKGRNSRLLKSQLAKPYRLADMALRIREVLD